MQHYCLTHRTGGRKPRLTQFIVFFALLQLGASAFAQRQMEKLNRGLVAVRTSTSQVYVGWRYLGTDPTGVSFNVYRGTTKLNATPITASTNYVDNVTTNGTYTIKPVISGIEQAASEAATVWAQQYLAIPIQQPAGGTTPDNVAYTYTANDCSVGDLDGDGDYDIVLKWDPTNSKDNSQSGYTGNVIIDGYKLDGTRLWRIDLGKNIRAGAHYTQLMVYDLDGDGKAEVACKTADGTKSGTGVVIGSATADYRNSSGYILSGPEYLTIFNGQTGAALATTNYLPARGTVSSWGDSYGNRVDRFVSTIGYVDGSRPSLIMGRGYYTRLVRVAWDWRNGTLTNRWIFDSNTSGNSAYAGQGNHQLTVGDIDNDTRDEIVNGSSAVGDGGGQYYCNGLGHGDALHMSDMDPDRPGQEVFQCHEDASSYGNYGLEFRDAVTGNPIWGVLGNGADVGRAMAADIDANHKGYELWGSVGGLYNCKGVQINTAKPSSMNFGLWWDANLQRELLDGTVLDKWNPDAGTMSRVATFYNMAPISSNNDTKKNPCISADILGDWREEVLYRGGDNTQLYLFTTTIAATNRLYTLMHNSQYRCQVAQQNSAYNQPPHPSYYLGGGMATPPQPNIYTVGGTVVGSKDATSPMELATQAGNAISVSPNPSTSSFKISSSGDFSYSILNITGAEVEKGKGTNEHVAGTELAPGIYIIKISGEENAAIKVLKN